MIRRPPRSTQSRSSAASDVYKRQAAAAAAGRPSWIRIKVNSIVDEATTDALYAASCAGVPIDMVVRGICAVRPGVPDLSENIRIRSILGRYLEHSRVFAFANDGEPEVFIGSADLMHRNLDRRVAALIRIDEPEHIAELLEMIEVSMSDETSSWHLDASGTWTRHYLDDAGEPLRDIQRSFIARQRRWPAR